METLQEHHLTVHKVRLGRGRARTVYSWFPQMKTIDFNSSDGIGVVNTAMTSTVERVPSPGTLMRTDVQFILDDKRLGLLVSISVERKVAYVIWSAC